MSQFCPHCGTELPADNAVCQRCEQSASASSASKWGALDIQRDVSPARKSPEPAARMANDATARSTADIAMPVARESAETRATPASPPLQAAARGREPEHPALRGTGSRQRSSTGGSSPQHPALRGVHAQRVASRANTGPIGAMPGVRAPTGPLGPAPGARAQTGPQALNAAAAARAPNPAAQTAEPQHPALRGSSARNPALRVQTAPLGPLPAAAPAAPSTTTSEATLDVGLTDFGGGFAADNDQLSAQLEIEPVAAPAREPERKIAPAAAEDPAKLQARRIQQLAGYGPAPQKLLEAVPYFFRVTTRMRQLQTQATALTQQRKRMEHTAEDAMCALGEALFSQRSDPRLSALAPQVKLVQDVRAQIGNQAAASKRGAQAQKREFGALAKQSSELKKQATPVEQRVNQLSERLERGRTQIRELEQQQRSFENEQQALKASTDPAALDRIAALEQARANARGAIQSLNVELVPLMEDLATAKTELARRLDELAQVAEQQQRLSDAADRNEDRQRIATGGAISAHREALRTLANAAIRNQVADVAQAALRAATSAELPIAAQRQDEELMRRALMSFDQEGYQRGRHMVAGAIVGVFVLFVLLIVL